MLFSVDGAFRSHAFDVFVSEYFGAAFQIVDGLSEEVDQIGDYFGADCVEGVLYFSQDVDDESEQIALLVAEPILQVYYQGSVVGFNNEQFCDDVDNFSNFV